VTSAPHWFIAKIAKTANIAKIAKLEIRSGHRGSSLCQQICAELERSLRPGAGELRVKTKVPT
jgi:hypothetical protein